jgi:moderate conductance mechanosensitive channel
MAIVNGTGGLVEAITFRTVVLRDQAGLVHIFPNGSINTLANATKDWSAAVIDVTLPYRVDTDRVMATMRQVGEAMKQDAEYASMMLEPVEIFGVENFTDTTVTIKARLKTQPSMQQRVGREFRRRLKYALQRTDIEPSVSSALAKSTEPAAR